MWLLWNREAELAQATLLRDYLPLLRDCLPEAAADLEQDLASQNVSMEIGWTNSLYQVPLFSLYLLICWSSQRLCILQVLLVFVLESVMSCRVTTIYEHLEIYWVNYLEFVLSSGHIKALTSSESGVCRRLCIWCIRNGWGVQWSRGWWRWVLPYVSTRPWASRFFLYEYIWACFLF